MPVLSGCGEARPIDRRPPGIPRRDLRGLWGPGSGPIRAAKRSTGLLQRLFRHRSSGNVEHAGLGLMGVIIIREMVGTSPKSWSDAARQAVATASRTVRNIQSVEVVKSTAVVRDGEIVEYRVEVKIGFEYEG
jgi:dodecin